VIYSSVPAYECRDIIDAHFIESFPVQYPVLDLTYNKPQEREMSRQIAKCSRNWDELNVNLPLPDPLSDLVKTTVINVKETGL
jgi:hypothetical protein